MLGKRNAGCFHVMESFWTWTYVLTSYLFCRISKIGKVSNKRVITFWWVRKCYFFKYDYFENCAVITWFMWLIWNSWMRAKLKVSLGLDFTCSVLVSFRHRHNKNVATAGQNCFFCFSTCLVWYFHVFPNPTKTRPCQKLGGLLSRKAKMHPFNLMLYPLI